MADYRAPLADIRFILQHQLNIQEHWQSLPGMEDLDMDTANAILDEVAKLVEEAVAPLNREADEQGCDFSDGVVTSAEGFKRAYKLYSEGGWGALSGSSDYGAMGMPKSLVSLVDELVQGGCMAFGLAPMLTAGACLAIDAHASESIKQLYLPKMYSGQWSGAMDLTEPHAGTDLGLMRTRAEPVKGEDGQGLYRISGTKIFITWGDHDMAENIVHLVLAKLPDAPRGSRGISMFLVPKFVPNAQGDLGERNAVSCGSVEKKMGIKASATCVMNFDGALGWLVGEPNKGLVAMFTMMNYERLVVGVQGVGVAEASYQNAVAYARERLQGRGIGEARLPHKEADPIIVHSDVRRMLMTMRALNEGGRAFYVYVAQWLDVAKFASDIGRKKHAQKMVDLLTPIVKAFLTDRSFEVAVLGQQVFGGHGFIREWGQEQYVRDIRITQIYEGTNGIQAMDLIGRKTLACNGELLGLLIEDIQQYVTTIEPAFNCAEYVEHMEAAIKTVQSSTQTVLAQIKSDSNVAGAVAVDYLNLLGYLCYGYMWLRAIVAAERVNEGDLCSAKRLTGRYYFQRLLPEIQSLAAGIESGASTLVEMDDEWF